MCGMWVHESIATKEGQNIKNDESDEMGSSVFAGHDLWQNYRLQRRMLLVLSEHYYTSQSSQDKDLCRSLYV